MKSLKKQSKNRRGIALVLAMIFVALLASLSVSMVAMSSANAQMANNHKRGNRALANSQSGLQVMRYLFDGMEVSGNLDATSLNAKIQSELTIKQLTGITAACTEDQITISSISLANSGNESFAAVIDLTDPDKWQVKVTGTSGTLTRNINVILNEITQGNPVFDYGVATKGPLLMSGQAGLTGLNADVFIDTSDLSTGTVFTIGSKGEVEGNVYLTDLLPDIDDDRIDVHDNADIGGEEGDTNVNFGADLVDFPVPDPDYFKKYVDFDDENSIINDETNMDDFKVDNDIILNNVIIEAGTNPTFAAKTVINGVLFVEQPNTVTFAGQLIINGIIVAPELVSDDDISSFDFSGQVTCNSVSELDEDQFGELCEETGSFMIVPDSSIDFSGQSNVINGVIACSGISFTGQAGGDIYGSVINYSSEPMVMSGQGALKFYESGTDKNPAGFTPVIKLDYDSDSYQEFRN